MGSGKHKVWQGLGGARNNGAEVCDHCSRAGKRVRQGAKAGGERQELKGEALFQLRAPVGLEGGSLWLLVGGEAGMCQCRHRAGEQE
jgi:hypothetical protein